MRDAVGALSSSFAHYELLLVGNGGCDWAEEKIQALLGRFDHVRYICLSRRCSPEQAVNVGLENVIGDITVVTSMTEDPFEIVLPAVERARSANAILFGIRKNRDGQPWWAAVGARLFHWYTRRFLGIVIPENTTGFVVIGRKELNAFLRIKDSNRHLSLATLYTGFPHVTFPYSRSDAKNEKPNFLRRFRLFYDVLVSSTLHPLRVASVTALLVSLLNALYLVYVIAVFFIKPEHPEGWPSISVQNSVMFFFVFLVLSILCEYVAKVTRVTLDWPRVFIAEERRSSILSDEGERTNVVTD